MGQLFMDQGLMTLVTVGIIGVCAALVLFMLYSVIWRAVRRGLEEFQVQQHPAGHAAPLAAPAPVRSMRLHMAPRAVKVPNYVPSDWS